MGSEVDSTTNTLVPVTSLLDPAPDKPASLLNSSGSWFARSRPQYETYSASQFIVATDNGISNDGTGDQSSAINTLLSSNVGTPIFVPAGIYMVQNTVVVPVGTIMLGEGWSQVRATFFKLDSP
jgi:glucan 1,3-beta-glucosidase